MRLYLQCVCALHILNCKFGKCTHNTHTHTQGQYSSYPKPSCRHTTSASLSSHWSSQTEPHLPAWNTSTRPSKSSSPPTNRSGGPLPEKQRRKHTWCQTPDHRVRKKMSRTSGFKKRPTPKYKKHAQLSFGQQGPPELVVKRLKTPGSTKLTFTK